MRDYPTVAQLRQVVLAEQERLAGKPQAALARLRPMAGRDTALAAVHWAILRAAQAGGDASSGNQQRRWLASHRGRLATESTTSEVLRFLNATLLANELMPVASGKESIQ